MEILVQFKTAELAKEKGFNYNSEYYFYPKDKRDGYNTIHKNYCFDGDTRTIEYHYLKGDYSLVIPAPSQSVLAKWLREVHNIDVFAVPNVGIQDEKIYCCHVKQDNIYVQGEDGFILGFQSNKYEDCFEEGLFEALKLIS